MVHVEGETEETFVRELLAPHLQSCGYSSVVAKLLGNARNRSNRGGIRSWPAVRDDILHSLNGDSGSYATTLVDYYALPQGEGLGWPDRHVAHTLPHHARGICVEAAMEAIINDAFSATSRPIRFVGGVLMHEFEALLFSDCTAFAEGIGQPGLANSFQAIRDQFGNPEEINDSPLTAPSKRVTALVKGYQKPIYGNVGALHIGLPRIRAECPHFDRWVNRLEELVAPKG
jgi:hypothetical protein